MDIKKMHEMLEMLVGCAKAEFDKKGIEQIDAEEMSKVTDMIKDLAEAQYYRTLVVAMEDAEYGEDYDHEGPMEERKGYRGQPRSSRTGRYMRRGYDHMMPMDDTEYMRDMDRGMGRMYYSGGGQSSGSGQGMSGGGSQGMSGGSRGYSEGGGRDSREGRSGSARRGYMESKEMHKGNSPDDKKEKMKELEHYMQELGTDLTEMIGDASPEEKNLLKTKMQTLITKIQ